MHCLQIPVSFAKHQKTGEIYSSGPVTVVEMTCAVVLEESPALSARSATWASAPTAMAAGPTLGSARRP